MANRVLERASPACWAPSPMELPPLVTYPPPGQGDPPAQTRPVAFLLCGQEEASSALPLTPCPVWASQSPHLLPTFQAEVRPGSEQVSPESSAALPVLSKRISRHDSSRAWGRPHHGQGALLGKLRSPQAHPLSPTVPNPPHTEQEVGSRVELDQKTLTPPLMR